MKRFNAHKIVKDNIQSEELKDMIFKYKPLAILILGMIILYIFKCLVKRKKLMELFFQNKDSK